MKLDVEGDSPRDQLNEKFSEKAFVAGKQFGKEHSYSEFAEDEDSDRLMRGCPPGLDRFGDVFKYGVQSSWRRKGELPGMVAYDLEPGDIFKVTKPDPESDVRVCLTNDEENGLRFGWPNNKDYWCAMGTTCRVEIVREEEEDE